MTTIHLAVAGYQHMHNRTFSRPSLEGSPALLVAYPYLDDFEPYWNSWHYREWILDSGAFSAWNSGTEIKLQDYIDCCKRLRDTPYPPTEMFALDVVNDWRASLKNAETMWKAGLEVLPVYHAGEPEEVLVGLTRDYPKIGIGNIARTGRGQRYIDYLKQCFARTWPSKIHGLGVTTEKALMAVPWHSVDSSSWALGPAGFGIWPSYQRTALRLSNAGAGLDLRPEVDRMLRLEKKVKQRWRREMSELDGRAK